MTLLALTYEYLADLVESRSREFGNQIENIQRITISQLDALGEQSGIVSGSNVANVPSYSCICV